jgi:dienelactone hydrolase
MRVSSRRLAVAALLGAVVLLALAAGVGRSVLLALVLAAPGVDAWVPRLAPEPTREEVRIGLGDRGALVADLYRPPAARGALLLVHGLSPAGRRHPELVRLSRLLAREGPLVLVPEFEGLAAIRLNGHEVEEVRAALAYLAARADRVGVIGFSFGAGPALLGAADAERLTLAASFGGYADLRHVIAFVTTGVHAFDGRRWAQSPQEYNRWKLLSLLVAFVDDARDRAALAAIARARLADPGAPPAALEADLGVEGRAVLALIGNRRPEAVEPLLARLSPATRQALDRLSPLAAARRLGRRLVIAHGAGDDSIPFSEAFRLAAAAGRPAHVALLRTFHHTGPATFWTSVRDGARDAWNLTVIAAAVVSP